MQTRLIIVRHGETESNIKGTLDGQHDTLLTPHGKEQIKDLAKYLSNVSFDAIFSSPLLRALETARSIQSHQKVQVQIVPEFIEMDAGLCTLMHKDDAIKKYPEMYKGWIQLTDPRFPQGENVFDVEKRAIPKLKTIIEQYKGKTILIVGHLSLNVCILGYFLQIKRGLRFKIAQNNCCINEIQFNENDFAVQYLNKIV